MKDVLRTHKLFAALVIGSMALAVYTAFLPTSTSLEIFGRQLDHGNLFAASLYFSVVMLGIAKVLQDREFRKECKRIRDECDRLTEAALEHQEYVERLRADIEEQLRTGDGTIQIGEPKD